MATKFECDRCHELTGKAQDMGGVSLSGNGMEIPGGAKRDLCRSCHRALLRWLAEPPAQAAPMRETDLTMPGLIR